jgi:hypothetical protein
MPFQDPTLSNNYKTEYVNMRIQKALAAIENALESSAQHFSLEID